MGRIYNKGASELEQCAHRLYDYARNVSYNWVKTSERCPRCGTELETDYCEERLYIVRCRCCAIGCPDALNTPFMLIKAGNPNKAAAVFRGYFKNVSVSMTQIGDNNMTIANVGTLKL